MRVVGSYAFKTWRAPQKRKVTSSISICLYPVEITLHFQNVYNLFFLFFLFVFLDPEWVNLDGFAVLGGAPVSNSSAGKPDLKAARPTANEKNASNLKAARGKWSGAIHQEWFAEMTCCCRRGYTAKGNIKSKVRMIHRLLFRHSLRYSVPMGSVRKTHTCVYLLGAHIVIQIY